MTSRQTRVVIDTNVLISSLWGGKPSKIIELWDNNKIIVIVSQTVLDEYFRVLNRFDITEEDFEDVINLFSNLDKTLYVKPRIRINIIKKDVEDNKFLECADAGEADFIISGDRHLLELRKFRKTKIISANDFLIKLKHEKNKPNRL